MNSHAKRLLVASVLACASAFTLSGNTPGQRPALVTLQSPEGAIETHGAANFISTSDDDRTLYVLNGLTGATESYSCEADGTYRNRGSVPGAVRGPRGMSVRAEKDLQVNILNAAGSTTARFSTYPAASLAFLSDG